MGFWDEPCFVLQIKEDDKEDIKLKQLQSMEKLAELTNVRDEIKQLRAENNQLKKLLNTKTISIAHDE